MVVIGISVAFFDTFYCVVAWEAITNVAVVDSKRTLDFYLLKVRVALYCILSLPKVLLDCCNKYFIVFCHVTLRKLLSYNSYFIEFHFLLNSRMHVYFYYMRNRSEIGNLILSIFMIATKCSIWWFLKQMVQYVLNWLQC